MRLNAKQIAQYTGGSITVEPLDSKTLATGITWDSREVAQGDLYVALIGERVDGHDFVAAAIRSGAAAALVSMPIDPQTAALAREMGAAVIEVPDTMHAITDLARGWRGHLEGRVIGITGSTGKTTTKNMVRDVLAAHGSVVATKANQNNELGVPRTLLNANPETQFVIVEMGMRGLGQITELCDIAQPEWGLITNTGECHIELLGSCENIARAKAELLEALPVVEGRGFVNASNEMTDFMLEVTGAESRISIVRFDGSGEPAAAGFDGKPRVWAEEVQMDAEGRPRFTVCARGFGASSDAVDVQRTGCHLTLRGMHNVSNACSAIAVGLAAGMSLEAATQAAAASVPEQGRQEILQARSGYTIINDAYNANPDSMRAALNMMCAMEARGRRYAVLGDMGELGDCAQACHEGVGRHAASLPIDCLLCVGELARFIAAAALEAGMDPGRVVQVDTIPQALMELEIRLEPQDLILVKASHFMELNRIAEGLIN